MVHRCVRQELLAGLQEAPHVPGRLESDDVAMAQGPADRGAHVFWEQQPVGWAGPWYVDEVADSRLGQRLSHVKRRQVQVVVMDHDVGWGGVVLGLRYNRVGERSVDGEVAVRPGVVDGLVYVGSVRRAPHIVLEEPQHRVAEDVVVLAVGAFGRDHVPQV